MRGMRCLLWALLAVGWLAGSGGVAGERPGGITLVGRLVQGGLVIGHAPGCTAVRLDGREIAMDEERRFVFGFGRDARRDHLLEAECAGRTVRRPLVVAERHFPIERVNGLPERSVTLPPEDLARRKREIAAIVRARAVHSDLEEVFAGFRRPAAGRISGVYGAQRVLNGKPRTPHYGLDIAARAGTPVVAPAGGIVRLVGDFLLEGRIIVIDHGMGVTSTLFHLKDIVVREGERVRQGQLIGHVGQTGRATGPHVDWRVNWGAVRIDPALALALAPAKAAP
ncbi:MAG: M23 family metallopeptidase [Alphaproteobacteria bacterium]|nr:MAG: M23 family metallopeptidase [Alphaproteobacteria bacterium]